MSLGSYAQHLPLSSHDVPDPSSSCCSTLYRRQRNGGLPAPPLLRVQADRPQLGREWVPPGCGSSRAPCPHLFLCSEMNFRQMLFSETGLPALAVLGNSGTNSRLNAPIDEFP